MDGLSVSASSNDGCGNAAVVLNGTVFSLASLTGADDGKEVEFVTAAHDENTVVDKLSEGTVDTVDGGDSQDGQSTGLRLVVDTSRGLVLSVTETAVSGVNLENATSTADLALSGSMLVPSSDIDNQGSSLFEGHSEVINLQPVDVNTSIELQLPTSATSVVEPKKGGWPKGRKRKPEPLSNAPKAPSSAYVLYSIERRPQLRSIHPKLPFAEITKLMGNEWSSLMQEEKQKYTDKAEEDKKRYIEELNVYQKSKAYQQFLKKKKQNGKCSDDEGGGSLEIDAAAFSDDLEDDGLYCRICDMYFNSQHNRKEHFYGKQHLQNVVSDYEKDLQQQLMPQPERLMTSELTSDLLTPSEETVEEAACSRCCGPEDMDGFMEQFMHKHCDRESEIRMLRRAVGKAKQTNTDLVNKLESYKDLHLKLSHELIQLSRLGTALSAQIDGLKMVPTLFGVINF